MSGAVSTALSNLDPAERKMVENYTEKELKQAIKMSECELISKALFDMAKELNENIKLWQDEKHGYLGSPRCCQRWLERSANR